MRPFLTIGALLAALCATACGGATPLAATPTVTDTFNGTVAVQGADSHNFTVTKFGEVDVTLTAAGPPATITVGIGVGTVSNGVCSPGSIGSVAAPAGATAQLSGNLNPGTYCVTVADIGNLAAPITYTVTVLHP